jgi:hypothetical protein
MKINHDNPTAVAKRAFFLAYEACGGTSGNGFMQARSGANEQMVWDNVMSAGDYAFNPNPSVSRPRADYVMGRMMKFSLDIGPDSITCGDHEISRDYQGWAGTYDSYDALLTAAVESVNAETVTEK